MNDSESKGGAESRTVRVLSIDGGGMRGYYTVEYLQALTNLYAKRRGIDALDIGAGFDLIAGTSTGAIIGCGLAAGVELSRVGALYRERGRDIFPVKLPKTKGLELARQLCRRPKYLKAGNAALLETLLETFGEETIGELWQRRHIALAIPAVEMSRRHAYVFKTPHLPDGMGRDDDYRLADVCMATSAAPMFRSMAYVPNPGANGGQVFVDGGLWANNPVMVGLIDALGLTNSGDRIEVYCLGTCPRPEGERLGPEDVHRGLPEWRFGADAASVAVSAQEYAYDNMAKMLARHVDRDCYVIRFPHGTVPADVMPYLDMDETSPEAMDALQQQAVRDVSETLSQRGASKRNDDGELLDELLWNLPAAPEEKRG